MHKKIVMVERYKMYDDGGKHIIRLTVQVGSKTVRKKLVLTDFREENT